MTRTPGERDVVSALDDHEVPDAPASQPRRHPDTGEPRPQHSNIDVADRGFGRLRRHGNQ